MTIKRIAAALLAALMMTGAASCGKASDESSSEKTESTEVTSAAENAGSTAADAEAPTEQPQPDSSGDKADETADGSENTAENSSEEDKELTMQDVLDKSKEDEIAEKAAKLKKTYENGVLTSALYSLEADESTWKQTTEVGVDCSFQYSVTTDDPLDQSASFNVVAMQDPALQGYNSKKYAELLEEQYSGMDSFEVLSSGEDKLGGRDVYSVTLSYNMGEFTMKLTLMINCENNKLVVLTYGSIDSVFDKMKPEFDKVKASFKFA